MADEELIKKFVELQNQAEQLLSQYKTKDAKQKYLEVVEAYHEIEKSGLEHYNKELAYDQVTTLFKKVNETRQKTKIPYHLIIAAMLIIGLGCLVFYKPSIVGLVSLEDSVRQPVNMTFTETKITQITLRDRPLSLSVTGTYNGTVKLFAKQGDKFELIFDSAKAKNGTFIDVCEETCEMTAQSNVIELFAQMEKGSTLTLKEVYYKIERKSNGPPIWKATSKTFKAQVNKQTTIDLKDYFEDPDGNPMVFLSTADEGLGVTVVNSKVIMLPKTTGTKKIVLIASDLLQVTRVPVTVEVI